jgi:hypothetical protein
VIVNLGFEFELEASPVVHKYFPLLGTPVACAWLTTSADIATARAVIRIANLRIVKLLSVSPDKWG